MASLTKVVGLTTALMRLLAGGRSTSTPGAALHQGVPGAARNASHSGISLPIHRGYPPGDHSTRRPIAQTQPARSRSGQRSTRCRVCGWSTAISAPSSSGRSWSACPVEKLDAYLASHVFGPLRMASTRYLPGRELLPHIAQAEYDPWRQRHIRGESRENAYSLGGVSAHAGLFSTGHDVARFCRMLLGGGALDGVRIVSAGPSDDSPPSRTRRFPTERSDGKRLTVQIRPAISSGGAPAFGHTGLHRHVPIWVDTFTRPVRHLVDEPGQPDSPEACESARFAPRSPTSSFACSISSTVSSPSPSPSTPGMNITAIDWAIVVGYFALSTLIGFIFTKRGGESLEGVLPLRAPGAVVAGRGGNGRDDIRGRHAARCDGARRHQRRRRQLAMVEHGDQRHAHRVFFARLWRRVPRDD